MLGFFRYLKARRQRLAAMADLAHMDDHLLRDIGITRCEIEVAVQGEVYRPAGARTEQEARPVHGAKVWAA
ncbi:MAG: DUF1127 domain-containing protein [Alphaproteobacteria bacterium]|nr:DUF1127 domain-containing protein [Alphaproteobacteria bacterium]